MNRALITLPIGLISLIGLAGCPNGTGPENQNASPQQQTRHQQSTPNQNQAHERGTTATGSASAQTPAHDAPRNDRAPAAFTDLQLEWAELTSSPADAQVANPTTEQIDITLHRLASDSDGFVILSNTANNTFIQATMVDGHVHVEFHDNASDNRARTTTRLAGATEAFLAFAAGEYGYFSTEAWIPIAIDGSDIGS